MTLYLLGRRLMTVAEDALPKGDSVNSGRLVFVDVAHHPDSSISEITERTSLPQSLVSTAVARLRDLGLLESRPDPHDRRRTLVRTTAARTAARRRLEAVSIDDLVAAALASDDQEHLAEAIAALNLLAELLLRDIHVSDTTVAAR